MRSSISSRSRHNTHRSSFSRTHHSSLSSHHSSLSRSHSSLGSTHHHRSSLSRLKNNGVLKSHKSSFKHHGISDAHAFAVGKATGVNINGSPLGAHGAALHRSKMMRDSLHRNSGIHHSTQASSARRRIKFSKTNTKYRSRRFVLDPLKNSFVEQFTDRFIGRSKFFFWIPFILFIIIAIIMIIAMYKTTTQMRLF